MDLSSGLPFHWILNGLPHRYPVLEDDPACDVLIIGGGITGALCAHACVKGGLGVVVVDVRAIGTGSTAASTALLQYEIDTPLHELAGLIGERDAVRAYHLGIEAVDQLVELAEALGERSVARRQSLQFASKRSHERHLEREHVLRTAHGMRVDLLTRAETKRLFPSIDAAALMSHDAAELDPYSFTHALLNNVIDSGGAVYDRTEVVHFERRSSGGFDLRTRNDRTINANHVIMATGYESQRYLSEPVMQLHSTYAVASERIPMDRFWHQDCLIWETAKPYLYLRTTPDRRVIVGGLDEPFRDPRRRDALLARKSRQLTKAVQALVPSLPFTPEYAWCGTFGSTKDGLPYIDKDPKHGLWFVLGMGGNGITFSRIGADIVRDAILGKPNADARLFRFDR